MPELVGSFSHLRICQSSESRTSLKKPVGPTLTEVLKRTELMQKLEKEKKHTLSHCTCFIISFYIKIYKEITASSQ